MAFSSVANSDFEPKLEDEPLSYVTESVAPVGENESWKMISFIWWVHIRNEPLAELLPRKSCLIKPQSGSQTRDETELCRKGWFTNPVPLITRRKLCFLANPIASWMSSGVLASTPITGTLPC